MGKVNIRQKLSLFEETWTPKILGAVNDSYVKVFKAKGAFDWHTHAEDDEFFLVIRGELTIQQRDGDVTLGEGEFYIVPRGVAHRPVAEQECHVLLFEPKGVVNTGDVESENRVSAPEWI